MKITKTVRTPVYRRISKHWRSHGPILNELIKKYLIEGLKYTEK